VLHLALLAPDIVQQIVDGQQPRTLSLAWLKNDLPPRDWQAQQSLFEAFDELACSSKSELGGNGKSKPKAGNPRRYRGAAVG